MFALVLLFQPASLRCDNYKSPVKLCTSSVAMPSDSKAFVHGKKASKGSTYILNQVDAKMTSHVSDDKHVLTGTIIHFLSISL